MFPSFYILCYNYSREVLPLKVKIESISAFLATKISELIESPIITAYCFYILYYSQIKLIPKGFGLPSYIGSLSVMNFKAYTIAPPAGIFLPETLVDPFNAAAIKIAPFYIYKFAYTNFL